MEKNRLAHIAQTVCAQAYRQAVDSLFSNTEAAENNTEQVVGAKFASDFA